MSSDVEPATVRLQKELDTLRADYLELVHVVSHDLMGPLRQIDGFANLILEKHADSFDDKTKRHFDFIINGSEQGKNILDALLRYSYLVNEERSLVEVDCKAAINNALNSLSSLVVETGATVNIRSAAVVTGDNKQIELLFYHLIHNALHYRRSDVPPVITIESEELEHEWRFCIQDNGIGIRDKLAENIFVALKRGVSNKKHTGSGMGLTISRAIVRRHGGDISVHSKTGEGSLFRFTMSKEATVE